VKQNGTSFPSSQKKSVSSVYLNSGPEHRDRVSNSAWNGAA
jgi:hypothetical protein